MYKGCHEIKNESTVLLFIVPVLHIFKQEIYNEEVDMAKISYHITGHFYDS